MYVITGASNGIGFELCVHLAMRKKKVIAIARNELRLKLLQSNFSDLIQILPTDLSKESEREKAVKQIISLGSIKGLVNNAANNQPISLLQDLNLTEWQQLTAINIDAPIFLTQGLLPILQGGRIINITTGSTSYIVTGSASYAITKAAVNMFTKYLSKELINREILVAAAHPGIVETNLIENINGAHDKELEIYTATQNFKKHNQYLPASLSAKFLTWLLLDADNSFYTGEVIGIYNQTLQKYWHDQIIPSPYPTHILPP